ncbi:MAG: ABC transporter substrate-binding protein [Chloroflexi bacterium]|nr:ABC transporter substrate-binding protein [Chloroflexota bacterium]
MNRNLQKRLGLLVAGAFVLALGVACAGAPTPTPTSAPPPTKQAAAPTKAAAAPTKAAEPAKAAAAPTKAAAPAKPKDLDVVKVAMQGQSSDAAAFIAQGRGYFKEQGIDFQFSPVGAPAQMVPMIATSQVDVAGVLGSAGYFNALERGARMKGVADKGSLSKGNGFIALLVRKDLVDSGKYKGVADLKGLKVALSPPPMTSPNAYNLESALQTVGLTMNDVELVGLALADMPAALAGGSIDAGVTTEPYVSKGVELGAAIRVLGFDEVNLNHQLTGISFSEAFMRDRPDVAKRFVVAYIKGARDYNDAFMKNKGKAEVIKILTELTALKDASVWEKMVPPGLNPDGYLNAESLMNTVDWLLKNDQIKQKPKPEDFIDNQYVDYAIGVLGKYK